MSHLNVEIKAKCHDPAFIRDCLRQNKAEFRGLDIQTDTYFNVKNGRLKLREGNIENNLIYYERPDQAGPKQSRFSLLKVDDPVALKDVLARALGMKSVITKRREIYYIGNVKFHLDEVPGLGSFVEIEAGNLETDHDENQLKAQCNHYLLQFRIQTGDLVNGSYSDILA